MAIGQKGIKAGRAYVELGVDDKLARGLRRAQARLKAFGAAVGQVGARLEKISALMAAPLAAAAKYFSSYGDQVAKMSKRTGVSVEALSELRFVASQTGTEFGALENAFRKMQRSIYDAGRGLSTQVDAFGDLGLAFGDFEGLSPIEQFKLLADRISQVEDPTKKAAIAMSLLGRSGTALLPMFAEGAAGIEKYMKAARRLGLTMSKEDAEAAEEFTDKMDAMWQVVKMGAFHIGSALGPMLSKLAETIMDISKRISDWIKTNKGLIVSFAKVVGIIGGVGVALMGLGAVISIIAAAFGVLATVVGVLKIVLAAILSPIVLVITAVAAMGAYILYATGAAGKALVWLGGKFGWLKDDAISAYQGICDALATGDIGLAAKIMWLTLKKAWLIGTGALRKVWANMWFGVRAVHEVAVHAMTLAFLNALTLWRKATAGTKGFVSDIWTAIKMIAREAGAEIEGAFDKSFDVAKRVQEIRLAAYGEFETIEKKRQIQLKLAKDLHEIQIKLANNEHNRNMADIETEHQSKMRAIDDELAETEKQRREAIESAKLKKRKAAEEGGPGAMKSPDDTLNQFKNDLAGLGDTLNRASERTIGVKGAFYANRARGLGAGGAADRTAKATEQTAKNTAKLVNEAVRMILAFT